MLQAVLLACMLDSSRAKNRGDLVMIDDVDHAELIGLSPNEVFRVLWIREGRMLLEREKTGELCPGLYPERSFVTVYDMSAVSL